MATVHLVRLWDLEEVAARTMKGLPRDCGKADSWWKACRRTFRGTKWEHWFAGEPTQVLVKGDSVRFAVGSAYAILVDRKREMLTS